MHTPLSRRAWLGRTASATAAALALSNTRAFSAEEKLPRTRRSRMMMSLAAFFFLAFFKDDKKRRGEPTGKTIDMFDFVDFCAEHHCDGAEVTSYYFPKDTDREFLIRLKRHAFLRGVAISGSAIGNTFTYPAGPDRERELG